jgi:hypothetical protein
MASHGAGPMAQGELIYADTLRRHACNHFAWTCLWPAGRQTHAMQAIQNIGATAALQVFLLDQSKNPLVLMLKVGDASWAGRKEQDFSPRAKMGGPMRRLLAGLFAGSAMMTPCGTAWAQGHNSQATLGSQGTEVVVVECPAGEVLTGFTGRVGAGIDRIQVLCAAMLADGSFGAPHPVRGAYGGLGGGEAGLHTCDRNSRISLARVALVPANNMVQLVQLVCSDENDQPTAYRVFGESGTGDYGARAEYRCPDESFTGVRIRFDSAVRGIGLLCDVRTPIAAAAPPAPRPLGATGRARPTAPAVAARTMFAGKWRTRTSSNADFDIILTPHGDGIAPMAGRATEVALQVSGQFVNLQNARDYDGALQGVIPPNSRTLTYTYTQKNGATGSGIFTLSADGNAITGEGATSDGQKFTWNGTRAE